MPITIGQRLGSYEITASLGKGGMGEVYRARDSRLNRDVAIKVSAEKFSERFAREAKIIASLNHPGICTLHDVGPDYVVMELVEGRTLADRIKDGPLPLEEAAAIARQVAEALEFAHEKGVVHRDLKPGNIMLRPDGMVKVLDFGLAKTGGTPLADSENSPTLTMQETALGVILGTAAYMSPEQAKGHATDKRGDIWSFGVVFYEMLTGQRLFHGETTSETLAGVLKEEPQWDKVPPQAQKLLKRCLEKDPQKRLRHIGDVMSLLDEPREAVLPRAGGSQSGARKWLWPALAVLGIVAAALAAWAPWRKANLQPVRFEVGPSDKMSFIPGGFMTVSPDGRWTAFAATGEDGKIRYWVRALASVEVRPLPGTEGLTQPPPPFWSPDSRFVAYAHAGKIKKSDITGGPPQVLCDIPPGALAAIGGAWNGNGVILIGSANGPLWRIPASGGTATPATAPDAGRGELAHRWPQFLTDGKRFLYQRASNEPENTGVFVGSIDAKPAEQSLKPLLLTDRQALYAPAQSGGGGYLVFLRDVALFAQPFDAGRAELIGEPLSIADGVQSFPIATGGLFSVSETGTLAYRGGAGGQPRLTWFDRQGKSVGSIGDAGFYTNPAISPDAGRVASATGAGSLLGRGTGGPFSLGRGGGGDIWIMDAARGTSTRFTFDPANEGWATWSPDGKTIVFTSSRAGHSDLYEKPADGSGEERLLLKSDEDKFAPAWSLDGRFLIYATNSPKTGNDLWVLPMEGSERKPRLFLRTEFNEFMAQFSPDGRWIAYASNESGIAEIYVRPFSPDATGDASPSGPKWMISKGGGVWPRWRNDGRELLYITLGTQQTTVDVNAGKSFDAGVPRVLFPFPGVITQGWDMTRDASRFLYLVPPRADQVTPFTVVLNWQAVLK